MSNEIKAPIVDHVVNDGLSLAEAGQQVQPQVVGSTVASVKLTMRTMAFKKKKTLNP